MKVRYAARNVDGSFVAEIAAKEAPSEVRQGEKIVGEKGESWTIVWYGRFQPTGPGNLSLGLTGRRCPKVGEEIRQLHPERGSGESLWLDHWELRFLTSILTSMRRLRSTAHASAQLELTGFANILAQSPHGRQLFEKISSASNWGMEP